LGVVLATPILLFGGGRTTFKGHVGGSATPKLAMGVVQPTPKTAIGVAEPPFNFYFFFQFF